MEMLPHILIQEEGRHYFDAPTVALVLTFPSDISLKIGLNTYFPFYKSFN